MEPPRTVGTLIDRYQALPRGMRHREEARHAAWWKVHVGRTLLENLTTERVCLEINRLTARNRSPSTVGMYLRFLRRATAWGTTEGLLPKDPCEGMELPKGRRLPLRALTIDEENQLCSALGEPFHLWVRFAVLTGLKQSEQFTLRWRDVDLSRALLLLPAPTLPGVTGLALSPEVIEILKQLRRVHPPSIWVFPDLRNPFRAVNVHAFYASRWVTAVHRAGIPWCAWKDLRHTCGVRLAQQGLPVSEITRRLRQRETRQAYIYRRTQPDGTLAEGRPNHPRQPVFHGLPAGELQALMIRDQSIKPLLFREAAHLYAEHQLGDGPSRPYFERMYRQYWETWAERPLVSFTKKELIVWYWGLKRAPGQANKALNFLRAVFGFMLRLDLFSGPNPAVGIPRYAARARTRFLTVEEATRFVQGLQYLSPKIRAYLTVLLLTGCRRSEALDMQWRDIDTALRLWRKSSTKNGTPHMVPLPVQAMEALQAIPRLNSSPWVFTGNDGHRWSAASVEKIWCVIRRRWGLDDVKIHDLRRTAASFLSIAGENLQTVQHVLNHKSLTQTSVYAYLNTRAMDKALQAQADRFCSLPGRGELSTTPPDCDGSPGASPSPSRGASSQNDRATLALTSSRAASERASDTDR